MIIVFKNKNSQNCWEYMNCPKEIRDKCEAYKRDLGKECWLLQNGTGKDCFAYNYHNGCINCPWYNMKKPC